MKNKIILFVMALFLTAALAAGCAATPKAAATTGVTPTAATKNAAKFKVPDVIGEISEINGNQITLKLIKMPKVQDRTTSPTGVTGTQGTLPNDFAAPPIDPGTGSGSAPPNFEEGGGTGGNGGPGTNSGQVMPGGSSSTTQRPKIKVEYTGETKDFTLPVGIEITSSTRSTTGMTTTKMAFDELKKGMTLQIYYGDDKKTISSISLRSSMGR